MENKITKDGFALVPTFLLLAVGFGIYEALVHFAALKLVSSDPTVLTNCDFLRFSIRGPSSFGNGTFEECSILFNNSIDPTDKFDPFNCDSWRSFEAFDNVEDDMCDLLDRLRNNGVISGIHAARNILIVAASLVLALGWFQIINIENGDSKLLTLISFLGIFIIEGLLIAGEVRIAQEAIGTLDRIAFFFRPDEGIKTLFDTEYTGVTSGFSIPVFTFGHIFVGAALVLLLVLTCLNHPKCCKKPRVDPSDYNSSDGLALQDDVPDSNNLEAPQQIETVPFTNLSAQPISNLDDYRLEDFVYTPGRALRDRSQSMEEPRERKRVSEASIEVAQSVNEEDASGDISLAELA